MPLTTGPLSFVPANQYGSEFAMKVAPGNLAGQVSLCVFCVAYSLVSRRRSWGIIAIVALASWLVATFAINRLAWRLLPASGVLLASIAVAVRLIPRHSTGPSDATPPAWDLPARIVVATTLVFLLTRFASALGAQLTGILATFPVFTVIFASFTHFHQGAEAASTLLHGVALGMISYCSFFLVVGLCLVPLGIAPTYAIAVTAAAAVSGVSYRITRNRRRCSAG